MSDCCNSIPLDRLYLYAQLGAWGVFLLIRLLITAAYLQSDPNAHVFWGCVLETAWHLVSAAWSHVVWRHLRRRRLIEKGWSRILGEGLTLAVGGMFAVGALFWWPTTIIYCSDFQRYGVTTVLWVTVMQTLLISLVWYWTLVVLLYFERIRQLELAHAEARTVAREAQLHALRGQVHPHFLFNSFNSLRALIAIDPDRAGEALTQLSSILRYTLGQADRTLVPLDEELLIVRRYLDLEKLRLGPRLSISAQIDADLGEATTPPLLLQGLVENAVKFGPAARKAGGEIVYTVRRVGPRVHVRVENPGQLGPSDSTGIGLRNLRDRLRLLYGDEASFTIREETGRVIASVQIPVKPSSINGGAAPHPTGGHESCPIAATRLAPVGIQA